MLTRLQILKEEKSNVDAHRKSNRKVVNKPLLSGNLGRFGTAMSKKSARKTSQKKITKG